MKKLFTLALLALFAFGVQAQDKKTWDFSKGWSDETLENLEKGSEWTKDGSSWKETGKFGEGAFVANGEPIKELEGLKRSSAGLSKNNNYLLTDKTFRLNRNNQELIFPSLKNGQKLTIVGRSANATAANRGVKGMYDYMVRIDDDKDNNLILGSNVEGSKGTYTFVYEIQTAETGEVPVGIKMITGGIDFTLFMIDDGDPIQITKVAYLCTGSPESDVPFQILKARENTEVTAIDVTTTTITAAALQEYTITIVAASVPADNAAVAIVKESMPWTPTLNLNANLYPVWGYGTAVEAQPVGVVKDSKNVLLKGATIQEADGINFIELAGSTIQAVKFGEYFEGDEVPLKEMNMDGVEGEGAVIHTHNIKHNGYAYLPYAADINTEWNAIFANTIDVLAESKTEITAAAKPVIVQEFKDHNTNVTITAGRSLPKTRFFYTTDGSDPTVESTEFKEAVNFTAPCTFKAAAIAEGYTLSEVATLDIQIHEQPKAPVLSSDLTDGSTTITLTCESQDVDIWYNFSDAGNDTLQSTKYTEPFVISMPQNVTAFAVSGGAVFSELTKQRVLVKNPRIKIDIAGHFAADEWKADNNPAGLAVANGKGMFTWGASAVTMYTGEGTKSTDPDTGDEITTYGPEDLREFEIVNEPGDNPQWVLKSRGTCLIWQNLTPNTTGFGNDGAYNPVSTLDVDSLFPVTKNNIQFYKFQANETPNGSIESLTKYQAPLDVVVLANSAGGPLLIQVSADGNEWTTIGEIAKTGYSRMWGKTTASYDGSDEVYVRLTQEVISAGAKVFDIYIANAGEKSKALLDILNEEFSGIQTVNVQKTKGMSGIYNLNGIRQHSLKRGLNIVVMDNGSVKKVVVK